MIDATGGGEIGRSRVHHDLHHAQAGDECLTKQALSGFAQLLALPDRIERVGAVADFEQRLQDIAGLALRLVPTHMQAFASHIQVGQLQSRQARQPLFDQPDTGSAANAFERQGRF